MKKYTLPATLLSTAVSAFVQGTAGRVHAAEAAVLTTGTNDSAAVSGFVMVDTMQTNCYSDSESISAPGPGEAFAGQDAQYTGTQAAYTVSDDGLTVYDENTGLTWIRSSDTDDDGDTDSSDKLTYYELFAYAFQRNAEFFGGYSDWRVPSIKELYSLMDFRGMDPSGYESTDTSGLVPFIDEESFDFSYGDTDAGERIIDSQYGTTNLYVGGDLLFGVNFADGRIKGYELMLNGSDKTFSVMLCRGNESFGVNDFELFGSDIVVDQAAGLMWQQSDSLVGLSWEEALAYAEGLELGGYCDWRLPTAKELQGIVDYTRSPETTGSAAIDPIFSCTVITNENNEADFPWYWSGTTHENWENAEWAAYVAFGRAMGYDSDDGWTDVHGAGCQRSDPKSGLLSTNTTDYTYAESADGLGGGYYQNDAPQGDAARVYNFVRCVRGGAGAPDTDTDGDGLTDWYEFSYASNVTAMAAADDDDGDGVSNEDECTAGTIPTKAASYFHLTGFAGSNRVDSVSWVSELDRTYTLETAASLTGSFTTVESGIVTTAPTNTYVLDSDADAAFYRVTAE